MTNENVHIELREHNYTDGKSYKIFKEVFEVDPKVENVVYFMEAVGADENFQKQLDRANNGEISYREVFLNFNTQQYLGVSNAYEEYPLLRSMSGSKSGKQIADLIFLQQQFLRKPGLPYWAAEVSMKQSLTRNIMEFYISRAYEFDKLSMELQKRGKNLIVIAEDCTELIEDINSAHISSEEDIKAEDLETIVLEEVNHHVLLLLLGITRDEVNAKFLRNKVSKLTGKTEIFSHFGTIHKYMPVALANEKFIPSANHAPTMGFLIDMYNQIIEFSKERDISYLNLIKDKELISELSKEVIKRNELNIYIGIYASLVCSHCSYKEKISYYDTIIKYLQGMPESEKIGNVKRWLKEKLEQDGELIMEEVV